MLVLAPASHAGDFLVHKKRVPGQYVVVLNKGYAVEEIAPYVISKYGGMAPKSAYFNQLKLSDGIEGFAWEFESAEQGDANAARLAREKFISYVEMKVTSRRHDTMRAGGFSPSSLYPANSLNRADSLSFKADGQTSFTHTGLGVTVYILDDAADDTHDQFLRLYGEAGGSRATNWRDATVPVGSPPVFFSNGNPHGTAMAACAAGLSFGVARRALVRVIDVDDAGGRGFAEAFLERAVNYILAEYRATTSPAVVNASFGYDEPTLFANQQFMRLAAAGIPVTVSAGNDYSDASQFTPSSLSAMIVVGNANGTLVSNNPFTPTAPAVDSNFGLSVDLYALGDMVPTALLGNGHSTERGSSQAAAYVAGTVATFLESIGRRASPDEVTLALTGSAGVMSSQPKPNTTTRLLFTDFLGLRKDVVRGGVDSSRSDSVKVVRRVPASDDVLVAGLTNGGPSTFWGCGLPSELYDTGSLGYVQRRTSAGAESWRFTVPAFRTSGCGLAVGDSTPVDMVVDGATLYVVVHDSYLNIFAPASGFLGRARVFALSLNTGTVSGTWAFGSSATAPKSIQSSLGYTYVVGSSSDPGFSGVGASDIFAARLGAGGVVTVTHWGTSGDDVVYGVVPTGSGGFVFGATSGTWPDRVSAGGFDAFAMRISSYQLPNPTFTVQYGTAGSDSFTGAAQIGYGVTGTSAYALTGLFSGALAGVPSRGVRGGVDVLLATWDLVDGRFTPRLQLGSAADEFGAVIVRSESTESLFLGFNTSGSYAGENPGGSDFVVSKFVFNDQLRVHWEYQSRSVGDETLSVLSGAPAPTAVSRFSATRLLGGGTSSGGFRPNGLGLTDGFVADLVAD